MTVARDKSFAAAAGSEVNADQRSGVDGGVDILNDGHGTDLSGTMKKDKIVSSGPDSAVGQGDSQTDRETANYRVDYTVHDAQRFYVRPIAKSRTQG